ncbi:MAG: formylglycine-generating enzyme family protein, partial [Planctomycetota bacterium]|nr:formylglycine-generating enzyme family protein [Planctomycetota bacterium]
EVASSPNNHWLDREQPCFGLSWLDGQRWLDMNGDGFRFPKEEEWEYACRSGSSSRFFWGDDMDANYCWYNENSEAHPHSPAEHQRRSNAFGLIDMLGNVSEWCDDWDGADELFRVQRGGNYLESPALCRAARRDGHFPEEVDQSVGMRVATSIPGF